MVGIVEGLGFGVVEGFCFLLRDYKDKDSLLKSCRRLYLRHEIYALNKVAVFDIAS